jgi:hypothetical protein
MNLYPQAQSPSPDRALFANPGASYRGAPFWSWNGALEEPVLLEQLDQLKVMGMGGAHIHARTGLTTQYLSDEFMGLVRSCVEHSKASGQLTWLYDEDRWPSGFAGGLVTKDPAFRQRCLMFTPRSYAEDPGSSTPCLRVEHGRRGGGPLIGVYALRFVDGRLASSRRLPADAAQAAPDETVYWAYLETPPPSSWYNGQTNVDVLNPAAIRRFIEITHERYRAEVGDEFGRSIPAIFTDEPLFTGKFQAESISDRRDLFLPWTADLAATLLAAHGLDIAEHLPWLFFDPPVGTTGPAPGVARIRWSWHDHVAERFRQAYAEQVGSWCGRHDLLMTGHLESESTLASQTARAGECMRFYQPMQLPGVDMLFDAIELTTVLQARSVARQEGRQGVTSELYGVTNWDFTFAGHKRQGDWQAALGVTVRVHHLAWYTMAGEAKRDYPAPIDAHSPWWREYHTVEDHYARLNTCLTRGTARCRVVMVHPVESMWVRFGQLDADQDERESLEAQFRDCTAWLAHGLIDTDYLAESLISRQSCMCGEGTVTIGAMTYDTILVPGLTTIRATTLDLLDRCRAAGVRVIFVGRVPSLVNALVSDRAQRFVTQCQHLPGDRTSLLQALADRREVAVTSHSANGCPEGLLHQLRDDGEGRWLFLCNSTHHDHGHLTVAIKGAWTAERWDTTTGHVSALPLEITGGWSRTDWECYAAGHILIRLLPCPTGASQGAPRAAVGGGAAWWEDGVVAVGSASSEFQLAVDDPRAIERDEPNVLLLDQAVGSLDGGPDEPLCEILRQDNLWRSRLGWGPVTSFIAQPWSAGNPSPSHRIRLRWTVVCRIAVRGAHLALERAEQAILRLDGQVITAQPDGHWVDRAIRTVPLPDLAPGTHLLEAELPYGQDTILDWAYLLGDFGVTVSGRRAEITALPPRTTWGDLVHQGLPFYAGNITYRFNVHHPGGRLKLQTHRFRSPVLGVHLDGAPVGTIAWSPWTVDFGEVAAGIHDIALICHGDRRNAFGQVHHAAPELNRWWGPDSWRTAGAGWSDEYLLQPHGILSAPIITVYPTESGSV